ncbi:MAG: fatty acid desaturase [Sphingobacteriaceae bacterium]
MTKAVSNWGVAIALLVITSWALGLYNLLYVEFAWSNPWSYALVLLQMHLYTGLFITAHDAMHGTVSANKALNNFIGGLCTLLYALFPLSALYHKHHEHHRYVHTEKDPDFHSGNFFAWYLNFMKTYVRWWQILAMSVLFNVLKIWFSEINLLLAWVLPSLLSTVQLFFFGTWLPHHGEHTNAHQSNTLRKNHFLAFISCYFFGYHYEHHDSPGTPWWRLWQLK